MSDISLDDVLILTVLLHGLIELRRVWVYYSTKEISISFLHRIRISFFDEERSKRSLQRMKNNWWGEHGIQSLFYGMITVIGSHFYFIGKYLGLIV